MTKTKLIGILNITPDSFSDGGLYNEQLENLIQAEPDIIDIGAISTRPNQEKLPTYKEEIERFKNFLPQIKQSLKNSSIKISIDSFNYETIQYLLDEIKIDFINDQTGGENKQLLNLIQNTEIKLVIMHHLSIPADPTKIIAEDLDATSIVQEWLLNQADFLMNNGIKKEQIIFDPGIGFGKNAKQSWQLIQAAKTFIDTGYPILYGHSRKSFLSTITNKPFAERDLETAILSGYLANQGIDYLRIHNVEMSKRALKLNSPLLKLNFIK